MTYAPDSTLPADAGDPVEAILEQHAELRDVRVQIREAADLGSLRTLLDRLVTLLESHFDREEQAGGAIDRIGRTSARHLDGAAQLIDEHRELLSALRDLRQRLRADPKQPLAAVEGELRAILDRLEEHDLRENEMLVDAAGTEPAVPARAQATRSQALEVNLRRTAVNVVIPPKQRVLLEITADRYGVHENTKKLLREVNHRYVGWPQALEDLHRRAMGDFGHYLRHERVPEAVEVFCSLYAKAAEQATPPALRETAIRNLLYYLEKVVRESGETLPRLLPPLDRALARLGAVLRGTPRLAVIASPRLRRVSGALLAAAPGAEGAPARALDLLSDALREVYAQWLAREDPADWWRERSGAAPEAPLPEPVAAISHGRHRASRDRLLALASGGATLEARAAALLALPDNVQIERGYLEAATCLESDANEPWQNRLERIHWLIRVLSVEALASVHEQVLSEISHSYVDVLRGADRARLEHFVRETFASLRRSRFSASPSALNLIEKIGVEVLATGDPECAEVVIEEMLDWEFPTPGFSGFTDEWQVRVNPGHLRAIRAFLAVIETNPQLARPLIAALVVHLKIGGIFVADTDLFQKDVSALLNSGIGDVYHQVKHLLKIFPVYFNDIGAEGEFRDVSSRLDEITGRRDPLCHFLRKQCHVESNPLLIGFVEAVGHFWATGEHSPLLPYVPATLYERLDIGSDDYAALHEVFTRLLASDDLKTLFALELPDLERRLEAIPGSSVAREKAQLLFRLRKLVGRKYELDHEDLLERLAAFHRVAPDRVDELRQALADGRHEQALEILIDVLEQIKEIIVSEEKTQSVEDIYHKRHIAVGIPSMYGRYREEKFEAAGLSFRIESLANVLFERTIAEHNFEYITRNTLQRVARWLRLSLRALRNEGCHGRGLATGIDMLEQALMAEGISVDQYINVFQVISRAVEQLIRIRFLDGYEPVLERILGGMLERGAFEPGPEDDPRTTMLKVSEAFLRDLIAQTFGLQQLDELVGQVLRTLVQGREKLDPATQSLLMTYDADRSCVEIDRSESPHDGVVYLGNKGYMIKRLARDGIPVPDGFILTTELFRCHAAVLACEELRQEVREQLRRQVARLERLCGGRYGDPKNPLLISVRSGSAISMPGMLDTFLNVGMSEKVAEGRAAMSGSPWGAWDAYRRFLQLWGMGHGLARDLFDALMGEAKRNLGVEKKSQIAATDLKPVTLRYRDLIRDHGIEIPEDPFEQLDQCVELVLRSWESEKARVYRRELQIAEEWGTAVVVQNMVFGNLNDRSGTGVALTCDPHRLSRDVHLHGDFIVQGQGDDVVSGLVDTYPITEEQRLSESKQATMSLEQDFPDIYGEIVRHAKTLVHDHSMFHQEIEFTFESDDPADLYILQTRDTVMSQVSSVTAFVPSAALERAKLATGIGAGGGALSGRVAHTAEDIADLRRRLPDDPIILLRPDTVPDDVPLILQADGMVTARGGATSHAAVAAQRIGRTCVVGCRELEVDDESRSSTLAGRVIATGDLISINGIDGTIYLGKHPSIVVHRGKLA
ncbi:MAG: PEP-utilizing enzyme [Myxococcales bacterium]|nr:PEP-utilizing enzyme [Myxococcales bacterium]